jgi:hypothetical protein
VTETIDRALRNKRLLGAALGDAGSWVTWLAVLRAAFGLSLDDDQRQLFAGVSGGRAPPTKRVRELWAMVGRKGGKSRMAAAIAVYLALFVKYKLSRGERGMVLVLAMSMDQARVVFDYCIGFLSTSDVLRREIVSTTANEIRLRNGITIATHANSFRSVRGRTLCACVCDEVCFWRDDTTAIPDTETYTAVLPSLLTTNGMLIGISSAYRRVGLLYSKYGQHFGVADDDVLVVKGGTQQFNGTVDDVRLAAMRAADPTAAASEWDSEFRDDLSGLFDDAVIDRAVNRSRPLELPPQPDVIYKAYVDPSGGAISGDAYSICIGHKDGERSVVDVVRARTGPFNPQEVTREYAALCKQYRVSAVTGDKYAKEWVQQAWRDLLGAYREAGLYAWQIYLEALAPFNRGLVELPDLPPLVRELKLLQRVAGRTGKESVEHPRGGHDDLANAVCGCLQLLSAVVWDEPAIVAPVVAWGTPRAVPGGVLTASCAVAPALAPSPAPSPAPELDPLEEAKKREAAKILAEMTRPRLEEWRPFVGGLSFGVPRFPRHGRW